MHIKSRTGYIIALLALLYAYDAPALEVEQGAPQGFEKLDAPREMVVTLAYGGETLGSFPAHTTPGQIQFDMPDMILSEIPNVKDKARLRELLHSSLPSNADAICDAKRRENCGKLSPDVMGVIFNEDRLSAELFINKNYLSVNDTAERYLPVPKDRRFGSVYAFSGAVTGVDSNLNFSGNSDATYSYGEAKLVTQSSITNDGLRFDTAAASMERNGMSAQGGLFRSRPMQLITDRDIAGVSVSTSTRTVLDNAKTEGNSVILFLPRRSFVSIYREGRLYSSRAYEAGNQKIDTSELPEGAYNITLKIQEADGSTREEQRFFAKSEEIPAPGQPVYYFQAGLIRQSAQNDATLPEVTGDPLVRAGYVARVSDDTGLSIAALGVKDRAAVETGAFWVGQGMELRATVMGSSKGDAGVQASYIYNNDRVSAAIDARQVWMSGTPMSGYDDLIGDVTQATAIVAYAVRPDVTLGARASYSKQANSDTMSIGPYADWRIWQQGESMIGVSASVARNDNRTEGNMLLSFSHRFGAAHDYGVSGAGGYGFGGDARGPNGNARVFHDQYGPGESLQLGAGLSGDKRNQVVSADADWKNSLGQFSGSLQQSFGDSSAIGYGGTFAINAAMADSELHVGGNENEKSAVVIAVDGDTKADMRILVNESEKGTVQVGKEQVIYLTPFHSYNISVAPRENAMLDYDNSAHKVTLYPGNVTKLRFTVKKFYVVSAKIVDAQGAPLTDALLKESKSAITTDENGRIQAELADPDTLTFTKDGKICNVSIPKAEPVNGVLLYRQPLKCV